MTANTTDLTVRRSITVAASQDRAFQAFTAGMDRWWPRSHHIGKTPLKEQVIEPRAGGRCFGRSEDGEECVWGSVRVWEPPQRLVLGWHLDGEWKYDPDPARASEVQVRFIAEGPDRTRVELEHRNIERHGPTAEMVSKGVAGPEGWGGLLELYAKAAVA